MARKHTHRRRHAIGGRVTGQDGGGYRLAASPVETLVMLARPPQGVDDDALRLLALILRETIPAPRPDEPAAVTEAISHLSAMTPDAIIDAARELDAAGVLDAMASDDPAAALNHLLDP